MLQVAMPNPFRLAVTLSFTLAQRGPEALSIYSVDGRRVRDLARGVREPGSFRLAWDGRDKSGELMPAGVYYARFVAGPVRTTRTLSYLR